MDYTEYYNTLLQQVQQQMQASKATLKASIKSRASNVKGLGARIQAKTDEMFDSVQQKGYNPTQSILDHLMGLKEQEAMLEESQSKSPEQKQSPAFKAGGVSFSEYKELADLVKQTESEGDYDAMYNHSQREGGAFSGLKPSQMTIGQLKALANGEYGEWSQKTLGYKATPFGAYQFVGDTMTDVAKRMGLSDDTVFSPDVQDKMFAFLARESAREDNLTNTWVGLRELPQDVVKSATERFMANTSVMPKESPFQQRKGR